MTITSKAQMYEMLSDGEFGNTIPQFFSVEDWLKSPDSRKYEFWGVRSAKTSMHPACRMNVPYDEVAEYANTHFPDAPNISMMVDKIAQVTAYLEIWESPTGLVVEGVEYPDTAGGWNWRNSMKDPTRRKAWHGTTASMILCKHLNPNSLSDLRCLLDRYDDHIVELSALDRCIGTIPHRNAIVWEVRKY